MNDGSARCFAVFGLADSLDIKAGSEKNLPMPRFPVSGLASWSVESSPSAVKTLDEIAYVLFASSTSFRPFRRMGVSSTAIPAL